MTVMRLAKMLGCHKTASHTTHTIEDRGTTLPHDNSKPPLLSMTPQSLETHARSAFFVVGRRWMWHVQHARRFPPPGFFDSKRNEGHHVVRWDR